MNTDSITRTILLRAPVARVWRALADSAQFGAWFGMKFTEAFAPGRTVKAVISPTTVDPEVAKLQEAHAGTAFDIAIERMEPERLFSFRWHPGACDPSVDCSHEPTTLVEFVLQRQADGVLLTVTESGFDRIPLERRAQAFADNDGGWTIVIKLIGVYLERNP